MLGKAVVRLLSVKPTASLYEDVVHYLQDAVISLNALTGTSEQRNLIELPGRRSKPPTAWAIRLALKLVHVYLVHICDSQIHLKGTYVVIFYYEQSCL